MKKNKDFEELEDKEIIQVDEIEMANEGDMESEENDEIIDIEVTEEDEKEADEVITEMLKEEGIQISHSGIPTLDSNGEFLVPEGSKLTAFIDEYLITMDDIDARILNKMVGQERIEYLNNIKAKSNEKLIYKVAERIMRYETNNIVYVDRDELYAAGWHALAKAIKTFDPSKKHKFTTYSYRIILNEMIQEVKKVKKKVKRKFGDEVSETLAINISMDAPIKNDNNGNSIYVSDTIADSADRPDEVMDKSDIKVTIMKALDMLDPTEKYVMVYRYGLDRDIKLTQKEIADKLNQSQANISKIEKTCRQKLRIFLKGKIDGRDFK